MKKIFYILLLIPFLFPSCNDQLDEDWNNPNIYQPKPDEVVSGLFTHLQKNRFWLKDYGEWYWILSGWDQGISQISQVCTYVPYTVAYCTFWADDHYGDVENFVSTANDNLPGRFEKFYTDMNNYGLVRDELKAMEGADYDNNLIYLHLATVLKDIIALQTVDMFNSIPYFNAFLGSEGVFFTPYDDPMVIYKAVIEEYQKMASELPAVYGKMSELAKSTFARQDIFFEGDVDKWVKLINAQALKSCVRISGVAADYVKPILAEAVKNLPDEDYTFTSPVANENRIGISAGGIRQRGFYEQYYQLAVPDVVMLRLNRGTDYYEPEIDDPRLPVLTIGYSEDGKPDKVEYYGVSGNWDRNIYLRGLPVDKVYPVDSCRRNVYPQVNAQANMIRPDRSMNDMVKSCRWAYYNPITFVLAESPLYINSLAENDLLLAEVALKGLASTGKNAGQHINDAVVHSVDFWYMMNSVTNYAGDMSDDTKKILTPAKPGAGIISAYASTVQNEFEAASGEEDKMEILMQQKYIHLNIYESFECFAELRRTRHPKLEPITCTGESTTLVNQTCMIERFKLPSSERSNNYDEYSKVMANDLWGNPIFWVPQNKISEKYFLPQALKNPLP
ncbi:MAG: SusD/RagB family nutrient-binding outer membrane lipoprotein [Bacteroidales bacterium]|jgi:hypothetical protein|nr:SusD/RagB family nutrient-binding outer membrane lipoprotein [Bacteroidales bacterium]